MYLFSTEQRIGRYPSPILVFNPPHLKKGKTLIFHIFNFLFKKKKEIYLVLSLKGPLEKLELYIFLGLEITRKFFGVFISRKIKTKISTKGNILIF